MKLPTLLMILLLLIPGVFAASLTINVGSYTNSAYVNTEFSVPVTVTSDNVTGTVTATLNPRTGLTVSNSPKTLTFTSSGSQTTTFTISGATTGSYTSPFTITAQGGSTSATPVTTSQTVTISETPSWTATFTSNGLTTKTVTAGTTHTLKLSLTVTDTMSGVIATLTLPSGYTLSAGTSTVNLGTVTGTQEVEWQVLATSPGSTNTISLALSSTTPVKSETKTILFGTSPDPDCVDADGDGYNAIDSGCSGSNDCRDNNAAVNPGRSEVSGNSIDDDCDGSIDETASSGSGTTTSSGGGGGGGGATTTTNATNNTIITPQQAPVQEQPPVPTQELEKEAKEEQPPEEDTTQEKIIALVTSPWSITTIALLIIVGIVFFYTAHKTHKHIRRKLQERKE